MFRLSYWLENENSHILMNAFFSSTVCVFRLSYLLENGNSHVLMNAFFQEFVCLDYPVS